MSRAIELLESASESEESFGQAINAALAHCRPAEVASAAYRVIWHNGKVGLLASLNGLDSLRVRKESIKTIALYHYRIGIGGAENVCVHLANMFASSGYKVVLLCDESIPGSLGLNPSIACEVLPSFESSNPENYFERAARLEEALVKHDVDALVYNQWIGHVLPWDMMVAKALGIAFVIHVHGSFPTMIRWGAEHLYALPIAYSSADAVVCLNRMNAEFWGMVNKRVFVTSNPIRYQCEAEERASLGGHDVLWIARLDPGKRPEDALEIFGLVSAAIPDAVLHIVGGGSPSYLEELKSRAESLGIGESVIFHGAHLDPRPFYKSSSVMLMTSKEEGYPLVLGESKVFGLPTVMYDLPYLTFCENPKGIVIVPQGDKEAAADAVIALMLDEQLRVALGGEAYEDALDYQRYDRLAFWRGVFNVAINMLDEVEANVPAGFLNMQSLLWAELFQSTRQNAATMAGLRCENDDLKAEIDEMCESTTMRVGKLMTAIPRGIKDAARSQRTR